MLQRVLTVSDWAARLATLPTAPGAATLTTVLTQLACISKTHETKQTKKTCIFFKKKWTRHALHETTSDPRCYQTACIALLCPSEFDKKKEGKGTSMNRRTKQKEKKEHTTIHMRTPFSPKIKKHTSEKTMTSPSPIPTTTLSKHKQGYTWPSPAMSPPPMLDGT